MTADALMASLLPQAAPTSHDAPPTTPADQPPAEDADVTLGDLIPGLSTVDEATLPGFAMSDEPLPPPGAADPGGEFLLPLDPYGNPSVDRAPPLPITPADDDIQSPRAQRMSAAGGRYESRIQILDAYQYRGIVTDAPDWVDRNWIAYGDPDDLRGIPAGPCLRVPLTSGLFVLCRVGDYVCQQEVRVAPDVPGDVRVEVWAKEAFQKNFMPV